MIKNHIALRPSVAIGRSAHRLLTLTQTQLSFITAAALLTLSSAAFSSPILTEIHYNGIASGTDPDEFLELSNDGDFSLELTAWRFTQGVSYIFETGATLAPGTSLVIARDPYEFLSVFSGYAGEILDFSGALSNSGETLTLTNAAGVDVWSVSYDDSGDWQPQADGLGSSLQLLVGSTDPGKASNWIALPPTPGYWGLSDPSPVPAPMSIALLGMGLFILRIRKKTA